MLTPRGREHGTPHPVQALRFFAIRSLVLKRLEDGMCRDGVETAGALDFGRPDCIVMRAEIESSAADVAGQADYA
jgi:hypothetical protein